MMTVTPIDSASTPHASANASLTQLRETTDRVVGSIFYGEMLKSMRNSVIQGEYGHGGRGEEVFGAQLDALLAERMGSASSGGLANSLFEHMEAQQRRMNPQTPSLEIEA